MKHTSLIFTLVSLLLVLSTISIRAQDNEKDVVIWSEDFTSRFTIPSIGKNAVYSSNGVKMAWQNGEGVIHPELQIPQKAEFKARIALYEASGIFNLSFVCKNYSCVTIKSPTEGVSCTKSNDNNYLLNVPFGTDSLTIIFSNTETSSKKNIYIDDITLTASSDCRPQRTPPSIDFPQKEVTLTFGKPYSLPELDNPNNLPIQYWNYDDSIASVDKNGLVKIRSIGKTKISATFCGNSQYSYQETSYILNVEREKPNGEIFYESFDKNLTQGGNDGYFNNPNNSANVEFDSFESVETKNNLKSAYKCIKIGSGSDDGSYEFKLGEKVSSGKCILSFRIAGVLQKEVSCNIKVYNNGKEVSQLSQNIDCIKGKWLYKEIYLSGLKSTSTIEFTGNYFYLDDISIIEDNDEAINVNVTKAGYSTLYYSYKSLIVPLGMKAYTMKIYNNKITVNKIYEAGSTIPRASAVVLKANEGSYSMAVSNEEGNKDYENMLNGSDGECLTEGGEAYYKLACPSGATGFYWGANNGEAFINGSHKAYLALPKTTSVGKINKNYVFNLDDTTTEIESVIWHNENPNTYNLRGQRVGKYHKGIVIRNGQKMVIK